jgi:hypothetical protein
MGHLRISGHWMLMAICLASSTAARSNQLFQRATCPTVANYNICTQAGLPSNFCCPSTSTCIPLAANTTVLCCPSGSDCSAIQPIICDITAQNATAHPNNTVKTTALLSDLPVCGNGCCPFGYDCNSANNCVMKADQSSAPSSSSSAPSSTQTTSSNIPASTGATTIPSATPSTSSSPSPNTTVTPLTANCNKFPALAVLAGFFPGLLLGILLTVASICLLGAKRRKAARRQSGSSFGNISEPQPSSDMRTDFLRKVPQTPSTTAGSTPSRRATVQRVRSLFRKSVNANNMSPRQSPGAAPPVPLVVQKQQRPVTPVLQREPSYEDINIFADGDTASALRERERHSGLAPPPNIGSRGSHQTTFTDMMERSGLAGLQKGQRK